ncbi:MAG: SLC13 family permease [Xanthomonadaceae bacterium]|nr:SLC13 family permease [Xanthomonadaceae bacterium]
MSVQAWAVAAIVIGAMALFVSERLRYDVVGLLVLAALLVSGILTPAEGLSGFSNEATVVVAAMFALNAGLVGTGALDPLIRTLSRIQRPWLLTLSILVIVCFLGAFVKNTALVATFLPVTLSVCARARTSPARVLIPMSYAAQMGGVCTLLGTSSNLLTNSLAVQHGLPEFGVFDFTRLGVLLAIAGIVYLMLIGRWLLPRHIDTEQAENLELGKFVTELRVLADSPLLGESVATAKLGERFGVYVLELLRGDDHLWAPREQELREGDVLLARGDWQRLEEFKQKLKLEIAPVLELPESGEAGRRVLIEALVAPGARVIGDTVEDIDFRWTYNASVLAVQRRSRILREQLKHTRLEVGDILLLLVDEPALRRLRRESGLVVLSERGDARATRRKAPLAIGILVAVVTVAGLGILPIVVSALAGCAAMALTGCFSFEDVYEAMDWKVIVLLGAILPLGIALEKTGLAREAVGAGMHLVGEHGPLAVLLMVYLLTALLTEMMGHNPSVVLMAPIAISVAHALHASPTPFVICVAFAAATSFATPVGYPTNTMVYAAGSYRFADFMKIGIPLIALFCALSMWLIPKFWPFLP